MEAQINFLLKINFPYSTNLDKSFVNIKNPKLSAVLPQQPGISIDITGSVVAIQSFRKRLDKNKAGRKKQNA